jgi:hypothetical protein
MERAVPYGTDQIMRGVLEHAHLTMVADSNDVRYTPMYSATALKAARIRGRIRGSRDLVRLDEYVRDECNFVEMTATARWRIPRLTHLAAVGKPVNAHRDVAMRTAHKVKAGPTRVGDLVVPLIDHWMDTIHLAFRVRPPPADGHHHEIIRRWNAPGTEEHPFPECRAGQRFQMCF